MLIIISWLDLGPGFYYFHSNLESKNKTGKLEIVSKVLDFPYVI